LSCKSLFTPPPDIRGLAHSTGPFHLGGMALGACLKNPERGCVVLDQPQQVSNFQLNWLPTPTCGWSSTQPRSFFRQAPSRFG